MSHGELVDAQAPSGDSVDQLLDAVLSAPPEEWRAQLERACGEHPRDALVLRRRFALLAEEGLAPQEPCSPPGPGTELGGYLLEHRLGDGGMASVFAASKNGSRFAVKVLREDLRAPSRARERFAREGALARELHDRHLCPVLEVGEAGGSPFLVMPLIEGETLQASLRRAPEAICGSAMAVRSAAKLFAKVADALAVLHARGLVHRDVKPANIMIDAEGEPVLVDFGLAQAGDSTRLTQSGAPLGTPAYMPPEQVLGHSAVDAAADVYALGASLYECLALRSPFFAADRETLFRRILHDDPPDVRQQNAHVPRALWAILWRCLRKLPRQRYLSGAELAADLRAFAAGLRVSARLPGPAHRACRWLQRHPVAALAALVVALSLSLLVSWRRQEQERARADALLVAGSSAAIASSNPVACALLAGAAWRAHDSYETRSRLLAAQSNLSQFGEVETEMLIGWAQASPDGAALAIGVAWPEEKPIQNHGPWSKVLVGAGHAGAWSPDGTRVAVVSWWGELQILDRDTREVLARGRTGEAEGSGPIQAVAEERRDERLALRALFTPLSLVAWESEDRVVIADKEGWLNWIDSHGVLVKKRQISSAPIMALHRTQDGDDYVVLTKDGALLCVDRSGATAPIAGSSPNDATTNVHASANGAWLVFSSASRWISRMRLSGELLVEQLFEIDARSSGVAIADDGELVVAATDDRALHLWRAGAPPRRIMDGTMSIVSTIAIAPGGTRIATGEKQGAVHLFDDRLRCRCVLQGHRDAVSVLAFSRDGTRLQSAGHDGTARAWRLHDPSFPVLHAVEGSAFGAAWVAGGALVAGIDYGGHVLLWNERGDIACREEIPRGRNCLVVSPGRERLAYFNPDNPSPDRDARVFRVDPSSARLETLWASAPGDVVSWATFLRDGRFVACIDGELQVLDDEKAWKPLGATRPRLTPVFAICSQTDRVACGNDGRHGVALWTLDRPQPDWRLEIGSTLSALSFRPDGVQVLVGTRSGSAIPIDVATGDIGSELLRHEGEIRGLAWSADSRFVFSASSDGTARITSAADTPIAEVSHPSMVHGVAVHPDGTRFLTAGSDGTVRIWPMPVGDLEWLARRVFRGYTQREMARFEPLLR